MTKLEWLVNRILSFSQSVHATYETMTKLEWLVTRILSFSQSVHATYETMTKLEWLVYRILSFSQSVHATYETMTDFSQCGARSGSPQLQGVAVINTSPLYCNNVGADHLNKVYNACIQPHPLLTTIVLLTTCD